MGSISMADNQTTFSPFLLGFLFPLTTFSTWFLVLDNAAETSLAKFKVLASQYCRAMQKEMPEASLSAAGFNQSHMKVAWLAFPNQLQLSDKAFCPTADKIYWKQSWVPGNQTAQPPPWFPNFLLTVPTSHSPRAAPRQDMTRLQATQSMDDTLMTAELLCCLPAAPTCPLVHQNMHFSVSPAQWTLSVLGRDKMTHCLLQTEVVLQKHDNLLFHLMQKTKIHQSL